MHSTPLPFDNVVLSTNLDPRYIQFAELVARAWRKFFPGVRVFLGAVTRDALDGNVGTWLGGIFDGVCSVRTALPTPNVAKFFRYRLAGGLPGVSMIHDMDTVPLQRQYTIDLLSRRKPGHLLCIGREVYDGTPHEGKFPAGAMTGEGKLFAAVSGDDVLQSSIFDHKEHPAADPSVFSDESLMRAQLHRHPEVPVQHVPRGVDIYRDWIDRSWWAVDPARLWKGEYVECNLLRPWSDHQQEIAPIVEYILA
jgi:hypothetical protein